MLDERAIEKTGDVTASPATKEMALCESERLTAQCGVFTAAIVHLVHFLGTILLMIARPDATLDDFMRVVVFQILGFWYIAIPTGLFCGWVSHWWFYNSSISPKKVAVIMVLIAGFVIIGWQAVLLWHLRFLE